MLGAESIRRQDRHADVGGTAYRRLSHVRIRITAMITIAVLLVASIALIVGSFFALLYISELLLRGAGLQSGSIIFRNLRRNPVRTALTALATYVLVLVVTLIWSVLHFLDGEFREKERDFKVVITSKYVMPSQMPYSYARRLAEA